MSSYYPVPRHGFERRADCNPAAPGLEAALKIGLSGKIDDGSGDLSRLESRIREELMKSGGPYRTCRLARGRGLSKKSFRSRHESLIWLTGRGGTPHIGMSLKDTITIVMSAAMLEQPAMAA